MGKVMGSTDPNATNDVLNGQTVATGTPGSTTVADPNQGLTGGQMFVRKALAGSLAGAGKGLQQQSGQSASPVDFSRLSRTSQPVVPPQGQATPNPQPPNPMAAGINGNKSPFPKGPNPSSLFYGGPGGF